MPFQRYFDESLPVDQPACIHLRSKAMYTTGEIRNPEHPDEHGSQYCWCNVTQHVIGPDQSDVGRRECTAGRHCFREVYEV